MWVHNEFVKNKTVQTQNISTNTFYIKVRFFQETLRYRPGPRKGLQRRKYHNQRSGVPFILRWETSFPPQKKKKNRDAWSQVKNTTEHSPFTIFGPEPFFLLSSQLIYQISARSLFDLPYGSLQGILQLLLDSLQIHLGLLISAWTKGAIWNTSDSPNPIGKLERNKGFERFELFREQYFHSISILSYIPCIPYFSGCGASPLIGGYWQMALTSWIRPPTENIKPEREREGWRRGREWHRTSENQATYKLAGWKCPLLLDQMSSSNIV